MLKDLLIKEVVENEESVETFVARVIVNSDFEVTWENFPFYNKEFLDWTYPDENWNSGFTEIEGKEVYVVTVFGDWEHPVYLFFFENNGELKGYYPMEGNTINKAENKALGNDFDMDDGLHCKSDYEAIKAMPWVTQEITMDNLDGGEFEIKPDFELMKEDFIKNSKHI